MPPPELARRHRLGVGKQTAPRRAGVDFFDQVRAGVAPVAITPRVPFAHQARSDVFVVAQQTA